MALLALTIGSFGQAQTTQTNLGAQVAGMREDVRILVQRVGALNLRVEQLERENAALLRSTDGLDRTYATVANLNDAVADLRQAITSGDGATQSKAAKAIQELARDTNASIAAIAKGVSAARAVTTPTFNDDFEKTGITYTITKGDTLSSIASRHGSSVKAIINANKIVDPTKIQVGQTLFIPGGQ
ncbi:MAG: LysM peptidoglycan-binding domain-containing protein [Opitutaceae bacterium]|nr:LysM peptidoglycan-binding domain-containing protein [Opitutaceae bacterium]